MSEADVVNEELLSFMRLSDSLRPGYSASLGVSSNAVWKATFGAEDLVYPEFLRQVYSVVEGTMLGVVDEWHVDFVPGYRLVHMSELPTMTHAVRAAFPEAGGAVPFLADYSGDYVACLGETIVSLAHDDAPITLMHASAGAFLDTQCEFYRVGAYRLENGFLAADIEACGRVGRRLNPGCPYWV